MDLGAATYAEAALVCLSMFTLGVAFAVSRRARRAMGSVDARSDERAKTRGKIRLLEVRAVDLARQVEELERRREDLLVAGVEGVPGFREVLAARQRAAGANVIRLPEASASR